MAYGFVMESAPPKTPEQLRAKVDELYSRVWYTRHMRRDEEQWRDVPLDIKAAAAQRAAEVEAKYGLDIIERDRRYAGNLEGWLAALRWALDADATETTEGLYDT
jgi:hypothetical protein